LGLERSGFLLEVARQMRLRTGRESSDLLEPDMYPLDLAPAPDHVAQSVQAVADSHKPVLTPAAARIPKFITEYSSDVNTYTRT
jgi:hypothetical protein